MVLILGLAIAAPARAQSMEMQSNWSRVMALRRGTSVIVTTQDSPRVRREFVSADDSTIRLRPVTAIGDPAAPVEITARSKVVEIRTTRMIPKRGIRGGIGGAGGFFGGALVGGMTGSLIGKATGADPSDLRGVFWGTLSGGIAGGVLGATGSRVQEDVIYRHAGVF